MVQVAWSAYGCTAWCRMCGTPAREAPVSLEAISIMHPYLGKAFCQGNRVRLDACARASPFILFKISSNAKQPKTIIQIPFAAWVSSSAISSAVTERQKRKVTSLPQSV